MLYTKKIFYNSMQQALRTSFLNEYSQEKYAAYLSELELFAQTKLAFRVAETPVFISKDLKLKMEETADSVVDFIKEKDFKKLTEQSIPSEYNIHGENDFPQLMVFDFGICKNNAGEIEPQLIEMQGFPSLYGFQYLCDALTKKHYSIPENYDSYLNGYNEDSYIQLLKEIIIGNEELSTVVLLEILPQQQKTLIDFKITEKLLGIKTICITELIAIDDKLFYKDSGNLIQIKRIFNRMIFDDLVRFPELKYIDLTKNYQVDWITHPNWFYRVSKYILPFTHHRYIPETYFLNEIKQALPLHEFVLKPLFSYAGMGVIINVTQNDIDQIKDPENWILQRKVEYAEVVETPVSNSKLEIRLFYFWKEGWEKPIAVHNLARLSQGKMIGTRYNQDKTWVGGTIAYFEK
jgi:hypothetical protein